MTIRDPRRPPGSNTRVLPTDGDELAGRVRLVSPDGTRLLTRRKDGIGQLWDLATGRRIAILKGHSGETAYDYFTPDGRRLLTVSGKDPEARLWDGKTGESIAVLRGITFPLIELVISSDGRWIAAAGSDATVRLWNSAGRARAGASRLQK